MAMYSREPSRTDGKIHGEPSKHLPTKLTPTFFALQSRDANVRHGTIVMLSVRSKTIADLKSGILT
jgi:hypothetical protein